MIPTILTIPTCSKHTHEVAKTKEYNVDKENKVLIFPYLNSDPQVLMELCDIATYFSSLELNLKPKLKGLLLQFAASPGSSAYEYATPLPLPSAKDTWFKDRPLPLSLPSAFGIRVFLEFVTARQNSFFGHHITFTDRCQVKTN